MRAILVSVDFDDLLAVTLPHNAPRFDHTLVVTASHDKATRYLVHHTPKASAFVTDAFYRNGATFNKGLAMEEALERIRQEGRPGWLAILDADVILPAFRAADFDAARIGYLYGPRRHILGDPAAFRDGLDWSEFPLAAEREFPGYCQIFHTADPHLDVRPWYGIDWRHAGGCDSDFQAHWPADRKIRLPWPVLHLGPPVRNWQGRVTPRLDGRPIPEADDRRQRLRAMLADRRRHGFDLEKLPSPPGCTD